LELETWLLGIKSERNESALEKFSSNLSIVEFITNTCWITFINSNLANIDITKMKHKKANYIRFIKDNNPLAYFCQGTQITNTKRNVVWIQHFGKNLATEMYNNSIGNIAQSV
jgi:hypothetical protein